MESILNDVTGDLLIVYGVPLELIEFGIVRLDTKYIRHVSKKYVYTSWLAYDREWLEGFK